MLCIRKWSLITTPPHSINYTHPGKLIRTYTVCGISKGMSWKLNASLAIIKKLFNRFIVWKKNLTLSRHPSHCRSSVFHTVKSEQSYLSLMFKLLFHIHLPWSLYCSMLCGLVYCDCQNVLGEISAIILGYKPYYVNIIVILQLFYTAVRLDSMSAITIVSSWC